MSTIRNKVAERVTFWATHEPKLRAMLLAHIAELADKADRDMAEDFADMARDALALLRAAAEPEARVEPCMTDLCDSPRVEGWRWCRECLDSDKKAEPEAKADETMTCTCPHRHVEAFKQHQPSCPIYRHRARGVR